MDCRRERMRCTPFQICTILVALTFPFIILWRHNDNLTVNVSSIEHKDGFLAKLNYSKIIRNGYTYVLSAIARQAGKPESKQWVTLNTWDESETKTLWCCFFYSNKSYFLTKASLNRMFNEAHQNPLKARQYVCTFPLNYTEPRTVGLTENTEICPDITGQAEIVYPTLQREKLAICAKIAFSNLNFQRVIEWLEVQKILGVDKVFVFADKTLNTRTRNVFSLYSKYGFVDLQDYAIPGVLKDKPYRGLTEKDRSLPQFLHDEHVALYDCQERASGYSYIATIDFDEILLPAKEKHLKTFIKTLLTQYTSASGFVFPVSFFITEWGVTNEDSPIFFTRYINSTGPRWECYKAIHLPDRVVSGAVSTHGFSPKPGYNNHRIAHDKAMIYHYRQCPASWGDCFTLDRKTDRSMTKLLPKWMKRIAGLPADIGKIYNG